MKLFIKTFFILFTLMQVAQAGRMFDPEVGRFISRDPLGYVDGMSLYNGYFAESFAVDPTGLWTVERKREKKATATAEEGDTITSLAKKIKLNEEEYQKWADVEGTIYTKWGRIVNNINELSMDEPICSGKIKVPNSFIFQMGGDLSKWYQDNENITRVNATSRLRVVLLRKGYFVQVYHPSKFAINSVRRTTASKELYGWFFQGHGVYRRGNPTGRVICYNDRDADLTYSITPTMMSEALNYKLSLARIYACGSAAAPWHKLVSRYGTATTYTSTVSRNGGDFFNYGIMYQRTGQ